MDKKKIKISVVTVCYNAIDNIEDTILSVLNQPYNNIEYIIIDGGSTDGTVEIIKKYTERGLEFGRHNHAVTYWSSEADKGIYDAMNKGIKAANGDYIININSGDKLINLPIEDLTKYLNDESIGVCGSIASENNTSMKSSYDWRIKLGNTLPHQALFYKKKYMKYYNLDYKIVADYEYNLTQFLLGYKIIIIETLISFHSNIGISNTRQGVKEGFMVIRKHCGYIWMLLSYINCKMKGIKYRLKKV